MLVKLEGEQLDKLIADTLMIDAMTLRSAEHPEPGDEALIEAMYLVRDYYAIQGEDDA